MRHPTHDYSAEAAYFVTICSHERHLVFAEEAVRQVIEWAWGQILNHFAHVEPDAFVVMPNHVHGILLFQRIPDHAMVGAQHAGCLPSARRDAAPTLSTVIRSFKAAVTRELRLRNLWDDQPLWQRNYYDRVVRDSEELSRIREYIAYNPIAWRYDHENPKRQPDKVHDQRWVWLENTAAPRSAVAW